MKGQKIPTTAINKMVRKIFRFDPFGHKYYETKRKAGYLEDILTLYFTDVYGDKRPVIDIVLTFKSRRLAERIRKEFVFFKGWIDVAECHDGGDDWALTKRKAGTLIEIERLLLMLKAQIPKLLKYEKKANLCHICNGIFGYYTIRDFKKIQVCGNCRTRIVYENIKAYA